MNTATTVQKLWNYCNVLRDDGMSYGDYVEQLALTLTLSQREREVEEKMADERAFLDQEAPNGAGSNSKVPLGCTKAPYNQKSPVPSMYSWPNPAPTLTLPRKRGRGFSCGGKLFDYYRHTLKA